MPKGGDARKLDYDKKSKERGSRGGLPRQSAASMRVSNRNSAHEGFHQLG